MKKIFTIALAFVAIALLPQTSFAQTDTKPANNKEQKVIKTAKGDVVPINKGAKETRKQSKPAVTPKQNPSTQTKPTATKKAARHSDQPREAIIKPIKNTKEKKVVVGKKIERKNKEVKKGKDKKVHKIQQNN